MAEAEDPGPLVVNVAHLMAYVDEQRAAGNTAFKRKQYPAALAAWQRALDACEQADGKPMMVEDVQTVLHARAILHSNRGQALIDQEWWRRAVTELDEAVRIDPTNAKALWRRYRCHRQLKAWALAEADLEALLAPELQARHLHHRHTQTHKPTPPSAAGHTVRSCRRSPTPPSPLSRPTSAPARPRAHRRRPSSSDRRGAGGSGPASGGRGAGSRAARADAGGASGEA